MSTRSLVVRAIIGSALLVAISVVLSGRVAPSGYAQVVAALVIVTLLAKIVGRALERVGQPPVLGELLAGLLIGPQVLGRVLPEFSAFVFAPASLSTLSVIGEIGLALFMFLVGLEVDLDAVRAKSRRALAISYAGIVVPLALGAVVALALYDDMAGAGTSMALFVAFFAVSMSVTAFPVLARILRDRHLIGTELGGMALACASVDDVTAWCLLAGLVAVARSSAAWAFVSPLEVAGFVVVMWTFIRPALLRIARDAEARESIGTPAIALLAIAVLTVSLVTEFMGLHPLFGAFVFGAIIPGGSRLAKELATRIETIVAILLPSFFVIVGYRMQLAAFASPANLGICALVIACASAGKLVGVVGAARATGMSWRDGAELGVLLNTRGLMEVIVANTGLELGIISETLFSCIIVMTLATTLAAAPLLTLLGRPRR